MISGTAFAMLGCMIAAALIPLLFILALIALFIAGVGTMSWFPATAVVALLVGLAVGLGRMLAHADAPRHGH